MDKLSGRDIFNIALLLAVVGGVTYLILLAASDSGGSGVARLLTTLGIVAVLGAVIAAVRTLASKRR
ncbi:hypothetical protein AB0J72_26770 [Dactylosporangium sp. NPDC049742]|uniref:hypothetical protein n=1 Tax=Dactylosporangium sp. NPDC049742 TaxID=3154737 RepID=UPI00343BEFBF